jgi:predicted Na+-dependent transporter
MTAQQLFNAIFNASLVIMLLTLVASLGMTFGIKDILQPLRRTWLLVGAIVVNIGLAPLIAIGICHLFPLTSDARVGVVLGTAAAAGPAGLKACELAKRADMAMAISFTIVLQLLNIVFAPLWAKAVVTGAKVNPWSIVGDLALLVLAPLVVGLVLRSRYPQQRDGWKASLEKTSDIAMYAVIGFGLAANWKAVVTVIGSWVILASGVIIVIYMVLGYAVGFRDQQAAVTISAMSSMRFTPIGFVVISTVLHNQSAYLTPALMWGLVDTIIPFVVFAEVGRFLSRPAVKPAPATSVASAAGGQPAVAGPRPTA